MRGDWLRQPNLPSGGTAVIFIHGILSSGEACWKCSNGTYWPDLLSKAEDLSAAGIYVYSYKTGYFSRGYSLAEIVSDLKQRFRLDKLNQCSRVIFVCHSMGGIIGRKYIVNEAFDFIDKGTELGIFLVASPSLGASYADWLAPVARALGHRQAKALRLYKDNEWLTDLDDAFHRLIEDERIPLAGKELIEDTFVILKRWSGDQVVDRLSGARYFADDYTVPDSDHFTIAKPDGEKAIQHLLLCEFVHRVISGEAFKANVRKAGAAGGAALPPPALVPHRPRIPFPAPVGLTRAFEDRQEQTAQVAAFLRDRDACILAVHGRVGVGKTALVYRILRELESNRLPDEGGAFEVGAIVYLGATPATSELSSAIATGLMQSLDEAAREEVRPLVENPAATLATKLRAILPHLSTRPVIVMLDNIEQVLCEDGTALDLDLGELLRTLPDFGAHPLKVILTSRILPKDLLAAPVSCQMRIPLSGLQSPFAERVLRNLDADGSAGLRTAADDLLAAIAEETRGFPRALEAYFQILRSDLLETPENLLEQLRKASHSVDAVLDALVGDTFKRLAPLPKEVMTALAVYGRPVPLGAIEFILQRRSDGGNCTDALRELVSTLMVRRDNSQFCLHRTDGEYALSRLTRLDLADLCKLAADYWLTAQKPVGDWTALEDAEPHLEEFRLRMVAGDTVKASAILDQLDERLDTLGGFSQLLAMGRALAECKDDPNLVRTGLSAVSLAEWRLGKSEAAIATQESLVELLRVDDPDNRLLNAEINLLVNRVGLGVTDELLESLLDCQKKFDASEGSLRDKTALLHHVSNCLGLLGYLDESLDNQQRAKALAELSGDVGDIEAQAHNLANVFIDRGDMSQARHLLEEALSLSDRSKNSLWRMCHLRGLARLEMLEGRNEAALEYIDQSLRESLKMGALGDNLASQLRRAGILMAMDQLDPAWELAERSLRDARDMKVPLLPYLAGCAEIRLGQGKLAEARVLIDEAIGLATVEHWPCGNLRGTILLRLGKQKEARACFERALEMCRLWLERCPVNPDVNAEQGLALAGLAECGEQARIAQALEAYDKAKALCDAPGRMRGWRRQRELLKAAD